MIAHLLFLLTLASPVHAEDLTLPREQACLGGLSYASLLGEVEGMAIRGLSEEQIASAMQDFLPETTRCVPEGMRTSTTWTTRLEVSCSGRVELAEVVDDGGLRPEVVSCLEETLLFAPFPAHDAEDGVVFEYPVRFVWR